MRPQITQIEQVVRHTQPPVYGRHLIDPSRPTRQHIHAVVRTPNGNDYAKDLLRQHYLQHPH